MSDMTKTRASKDVPPRDRIGFARDIGRLVRDLLIGALAIYCIFNPPVVRSWLGELGISRVTLFGIELTPGNEREIARAVDAVTQQRDAALFERNDLVRANRQAIGELRSLRGQLPEAQEAALARTIATLRLETRNADIDLPPEATLQQALIGGARRQVGYSGNWAVVYGGDPNLAGARNEIAWAQTNDRDNASILLRYNSYRSVLRANSAEAADRLLTPALRRHRPDAYVVNLDTWCPNAVDRGQYRACQ